MPLAHPTVMRSSHTAVRRNYAAGESRVIYRPLRSIVTAIVAAFPLLGAGMYPPTPLPPLLCVSSTGEARESDACTVLSVVVACDCFCSIYGIWHFVEGPFPFYYKASLNF
jgi:hypothetical protein